MKKKAYQSPSTLVYKIIGKTIISTSMPVGGTVGDEGDIGFVKEQDTQRGDINVWDKEW